MIIKLIKRLISASKKHEYTNGFQWAMTEYYIENRPMRFIARYVEEVRGYDDYTDFDKGVEYAMSVIKGLSE